MDTKSEGVVIQSEIVMQYVKSCAKNNIAKIYTVGDNDSETVLFDIGISDVNKHSISFPIKDDNGRCVMAHIEFLSCANPNEVDLDNCKYIVAMLYIAKSLSDCREECQKAKLTDAQTGIPNVIAISRKYNKIRKKMKAQNLVVLFINIQNFKYINETNGAKHGDDVLRAYANALTGIVDEEECVCHMGGDSFGMFIKIEHKHDVLSKLKCIFIGHLRKNSEKTFEISSWIGLSECDKNTSKTFIERLDEASTACFMGKGRLKKNVVTYSNELRRKMDENREIIAMFRPAILNHEFTPFFQAKVDMETGDLVGFESLCRWIHNGRFIYLDQFIPLLDKEELIPDLDMTIFDETCRAISRWKEMGLNPPRISSNFSRKNLFVPSVEKKIYETIKKNNIDVNDVEIEITESVKESETNRLIDFVHQLKNYGIHISIDDFGTGYSSLLLIHNIDADVIKIDKSFIEELPEDRKSIVLIESIISIAKNLNMTLIAEGVETAEQGKKLIELGCSTAQGYYYSKPMDFEAATEVIRNPTFKAIKH